MSSHMLSIMLSYNRVFEATQLTAQIRSSATISPRDSPPRHYSHCVPEGPVIRYKAEYQRPHHSELKLKLKLLLHNSLADAKHEID